MTTPNYRTLAALLARSRPKGVARDQIETEALQRAKASRDAALAFALFIVAYIFLAAAVLEAVLLAYDLWDLAQRPG